MKKTIYHFENNSTKAGRAINALLALLTANRYALIFTLKVTISKRNYQPEPFRRRAIENLFIFLCLFPIAMGLTVLMNKCNEYPQPTPIIEEREEEEIPIHVDAMGRDSIFHTQSKKVAR